MKNYITRTIITVSLLQAPYLIGNPIEMLKNVKKDLQDAKTDIGGSITDLKQGYTDANKDVITKLNGIIEDDLKPMTGLLKNVLGYSQTVRVLLIGLTATTILAPITGPVLILFGDLPDIVAGLHKTLIGVESTLGGVKATIEPANELLNPEKDTRGVYKAFNQAQSKFDEAIKIIDEIITGFEAAFADI